MQGMAELIDPETLAYAEAHSTAPSAHLAAVYASTQEDFPAWGMMVGRQEGRFLELLVFATQATRVLEIGTFTGYSSIAMAAGLPAGGRITTCEVDAHHAATARKNIAASPYADRIEVLEGPALASIATLAGPFDLVFIDADKPNTPQYFRDAVELSHPGSLIVVDNVVRQGRLIETGGGNPDAEGMRRLIEQMGADRRIVPAAIQTVGVKGWDGFAFALVIGS
jgi:predicted O-methyltransferase YrrM